jgi:rSAM/selenodomain-associated transferase 2/rSAM/selenodomain-associated transferase 1
MKLAVIIPFLDEGVALPATLATLFRAIESVGAFEGVDVIAVDGGSRDASRAVIARHPSVRLLDAPRGRASEMNAGAAATDADVMLFLHADCRLANTALASIADAVKRGHRWGRFDVAIEGRSTLLPTISKFMNARSRLTGIATGDQAIFVSRPAFAKVGGFPALPLMEDIALSKALLRAVGRPACLRERVVVAGRRWDTHGAWRTIFSMWRLRFDYWRGVDPAALAHRYRPLLARRAPILQIFAKVPERGRVKTRLASAIGDRAAASLYGDLVEQTLATAVTARAIGVVSEIELWCDPDAGHAAFVDWQQRYRVKLRTQRGGDLGARMHHALTSVLAAAQAALLIGTDCPALDAPYLACAAEALKTHDVVVGPAEDGGYVLIGLSRDVDIFAGVPWSTSDVMAITRVKIAEAGATLRELPALWDLDTPADFARFSSWRTRPMRRAFPWRRPPARSRPRARRF